MSSDKQVLDMTLAEQCRIVSKELIDKYGWELLDLTELTEFVYERTSEKVIKNPKDIRSIALNIYSKQLYDAVSRNENYDDIEWRCNQAFEELSRYLYNAALYRWQSPDLAQELAQDALVRILDQHEKCKNEGAFLKFCLTRLLHAWTYYIRADAKTQSYDELIGSAEDDERPVPELVDTTSPSPDSELTCSELWEEWLTRFAELYEGRANRQLYTIFCKFLLELTEEEIMERLDTNLNNVQALRSKGMKRLRDDDKLRHITEQLLENCS